LQMPRFYPYLVELKLVPVVAEKTGLVRVLSLLSGIETGC